MTSIASRKTLPDHSLAPGTTEHASNPNKRNGFAPLKPALRTALGMNGIDGSVMTSRGPIADLSNAELARIGEAANVPGVSHENGRAANAAALAAFIRAGNVA